MSQIKVMISRFYKGGAWQDAKTNTVFNPRKDAGTVFTFSPQMDLSGIADAIRKNHLVPFDSVSAVEFQKIVRDLPVVAPQVVEVRGKHMVLEVVFDRPVYPRPGKYIHVPVIGGATTAIPVTDAYMEGYVTAIFTVNALGKVRIDAEAFVDDEGTLSEAYGVDKAPKPPVVDIPAVEVPEIPVVEEPVAPEPTPEQEEGVLGDVVDVVEDVIDVVVQEAPKKKAPAKKSRKKAE